MQLLRYLSWLSVPGILFTSSYAGAQSYDAPMKKINFTITSGRLMKTDYCDKVKPYVRLSINHKIFPRMNWPHSKYGKGGISGWSVLGAPICISPGQKEESFAAGPNASVERFACLSEPMVFTVKLYDDDTGSGNDDLHIEHKFTVDFNDPEHVSQLKGCVNRGKDGKFCYEISVEDDSRLDSDQDGMTDIEETRGVDSNCDGRLIAGEDLFLHEMGVNPQHKDMLVEMNWFTGFAPTPAVIQELKDIFAGAPRDAGGLENPDRHLGINLIVDAGALYSDLRDRRIGGRDFGTSADSPTSLEELDKLATRVEHSQRVGYFRNIVFGPLFTNGMATADIAGRAIGNDRIQIQDRSTGTIFHELGHSLGLLHGGESPQDAGGLWPAYTLLDEDNDGSVDEADLDNDGTNEAYAADINGDGIRDAWALDTNGDGAPDSLDRFPGGQNCKPNHLSSMNYAYGPGISYTTGGVLGFFDDFSPSKIPDNLITTLPPGCPTDNPTCNRRIPLIPPLNEAQLDETALLLTANTATGLVFRQTFRYYDTAGVIVSGGWVDQAENWDRNTTTDFVAPNFYSANIDINSEPTTNAQACTAANNNERQVLVNVDEWSKVVLPPVRGASGNAAAINSFFEDTHLPFSEANRAKWRAAAITTDLSLAASIQPERLAVGGEGKLMIEISNTGRNPASDGSVTVTLPPGIEALSLPDGCKYLDEQTIRCSTALVGQLDSYPLPAGHNIQLEVPLKVSANPTDGGRDILVYVTHQGPELNPQDNTATIPIIVTPAFFSFEDAERPWVRSWTNGEALTTSPALVSHGEQALVLPCGTVQMESPSFDTAELELLGSELSVDIYLSSPQNPWYAGSIQASLDIPSAGVWNQSLGDYSLTGLDTDSWLSLNFELSDNIQEVLAGDYADARIRFQTNVASCDAPVYLDNMRFEGELSVRDLWHPSERVSVLSSSVLRFENASDWNVIWGSAQLSTESENIIEGQGALSLDVQSWARIESREFSTAELQGVTSQLAVDIRIPDLPADYYWLGQLNAYLSCPKVGLYGEYLGYQALQILFDDEYNQVVFDLSSRALTALQNSEALCTLAFEITSSQSYGPFVLDNAGFVN